MNDFSTLVTSQQNLFQSNRTKEVDFRIEQLKKLKQLLKSNEKALFDAIYEDFGKSSFETYMGELSLIYHEIDHFIKNIKKWAKPKSVSAGLLNFPSKGFIIPEPLGVTLVVGAWNYPIQLSLLPALTSLAAGNTVILKPSELPCHTASIIAALINNNFEANYFHVILGDADVTTLLLEQKFDKIFFTGSTQVGKIVYQTAAKNLTPVTLELGGKSPTFVLKDCDIAMTAKRIVWAKFLNAGQTCVAPDYILIDPEIKERFITAIQKELAVYPQSSAQKQDNYTQIINDRNFDRLIKLLEPSKVRYGGITDRESRFFSPTIMDNVSWNDEIMQQEIFGPILPILTFDNLDDAISLVKKRSKPLSLYIYSKNSSTIRKILHEVSFGGGAINDSLMHLASSNLPFGGVGYSGIGSYHGKAGFDSFSHKKSILHKSFLFEPTLKYAPYTTLKEKIMRWLVG